MSKNEKRPQGNGEGAPASQEHETVFTGVVQSIEQKIEYFLKKQELISRYKHLQEQSEHIMQHVSKLQEEQGKDTFLSESYKLSLTVKSGYRENAEIVTFQNPEIMGDVLLFVISRIAKKMQGLSLEISEQ